MGELIKSAKVEFSKTPDDPNGKEALKCIEDLLRGFVESGRLDLAVSASGTNDDARLVTALGLASSVSLSNLVDILAKDEKGKRVLDFNVAEHRGMRIHQFRSANDGSHNALRDLGAAFGISGDAAYFCAAKGDGVKGLKAAMEALQTAPAPEAAPLMELRVRAGRMSNSADIALEGELKKSFNRQFSRDDRVSLTLDRIPQGLRLRLESEEGLIRFIADAAAANVNRQR